MKALSIQQPWLWAITDIDKRIENRTWKPPQWIIGERIALHASKKDDPVGYREIYEIAGIIPPAELPKGAIVATAKVVGWLDDNGFGNGHLIDDKWFFGPIGWILADIKKLDTPILCRGSLGLWNSPLIDRSK
jgi:hypothetical protein